jgi:hypothetical protein
MAREPDSSALGSLTFRKHRIVLRACHNAAQELQFTAFVVLQNGGHHEEPLAIGR